MSEKIERFLCEKRRETPFLVVDLDLLVERYRLLKDALPTVGIYYAVKANPADEIVVALERQGACFDVAGITELEGCARLGAGGFITDKYFRVSASASALAVLTAVATRG